jgi:hypothetical protein
MRSKAVFVLSILILSEWSVLSVQKAAKGKKTRIDRPTSNLAWNENYWPPESFVNTSTSPYLQALDTFFRRLSTSERFLQALWETAPERWTVSETRIPVPNFNFKNLSAAAELGALRSSGDTYFTEGSHSDHSASYFTINETMARSGRTLTAADLDRHFEAAATLSVNKAGVVWPWIGKNPAILYLIRIVHIVHPTFTYA